MGELLTGKASKFRRETVVAVRDGWVTVRGGFGGIRDRGQGASSSEKMAVPAFGELILPRL